MSRPFNPVFELDYEQEIDRMVERLIAAGEIVRDRDGGLHITDRGVISLLDALGIRDGRSDKVAQRQRERQRYLKSVPRAARSR